MAKILAIGEVANGIPKKATREITSVGRSLGEVHTLVLGTQAEAAASEVARHGAEVIYAVESSDYNGEAWSQMAAQIVREGGYEIVLIPHSWAGRDVSARLATLLDSAVISDAVEIHNEGGRIKIKKPVYSGKAFVWLKSTAAIQVVTVRPNSQKIEENPGAGKLEKRQLDLSKVKARQISFIPQKSTRVSLTEADIVVSAGRGIKGPENLYLIENLADVLGAGMGATRAVVDAGWCDHTLQVGQTGVTVSPTLYIAVGISGAIQHLAGMGSSKYIVAINKDPDAPIFKVATYGVVDDLFQVVPPLTEEFKQMLGK
ncbi:MAG: electron transfer flavoprotein subunit alpha/FixB family protein [Leptospiraceae bacterium]|nr:electron transfer flavoprotein subunit alpha/FixB family protein [Leptospiraceae bacterium]MDW8307052.1 electron transfer flavoprotein subunit alpha/FixB family protein [Leptospiraceae bacterium]